ncbi:hypothetical protein D3C77_348460 [compost metagenome]
MVSRQSHLLHIRVGHFTGEGDHGPHIFVTVALAVVLQRQVVLHRGGARAGHHHGLGLATEQVRHVLAEMLNDQLNLLPHVHRVERQPLGQRTPGALLVHALVIDHLAADFECHLIAGVVFQHIEDEPFIDCLLHGVEMERRRRVIGTHQHCGVTRAPK